MVAIGIFAGHTAKTNPVVSPNQEAIELLRNPCHPAVKLKGSTCKKHSISAREALARVMGGGYECKANKSRVHWVRPIVPQAWQHCWRIDLAAVLEPSLEYGRTTEWGN